MSILHKLNKKSSVYLFNLPNTLTYSLFNYFYNKLITNTQNADDEIKFFHENGFFKPNINFKNEVIHLKSLLETCEKIDRQSEFIYCLNTKIIDAIKIILNSNKFKNLQAKIQRYFNLKMYLIDAKITRILPIEKEIEHKENVYSNNYHVDYYLMNFFKIFINLHDVDESRGPMYFYSKSNSRKFIKFNNYKDRSDYNVKNEKELGLIKNTGLIGDMLVCSTPQCLHRASSPKNDNFRDMLYLSFAVTSDVKNSNSNLFEYEKENYNDIWNCTSYLSKKLCKPKSFVEQIKTFNKILKDKII
tara:strand:+ start:109 stop:1014 length:906 start_codon:yes stop_codon:yes gene_type:complete